MTHEAPLYRAARLAGPLVFAFGLIVLAGSAFPPQVTADGPPDSLIRPAATALCLLFCGASLGLQHRGQKIRPARYLAGAALIVAGVNLVLMLSGVIASVFGDGVPESRGFFPGAIGGFTTLASVTAALALLSLHGKRTGSQRPLHLWLAIFTIAAAGGSFVAESLTAYSVGPEVDLFGSPALAAYATAGLLLTGIGAICARPQDKLPRMLFAPTAAGLIARRLLLGALLVPAAVTTGQIFLGRSHFFTAPGGAAGLTVVAIMGGLMIILFAAETSLDLDEQRQEADQTRELLTARLQEQAAQLQETVARRTHDLRRVNFDLQALNQRLELARQSAALGIWEWDAATQHCFLDKRILEIYGLPESASDGTVEDRISHVHPDDRDRARAAFANVLAGANDYTLACRIVRPDGTVRFIESRGLVQRDTEGKLWRVIGTERDITAQHESTQQTLMLNERLQLALRSSNYGVWMLDLASDQLVWDDRMLEIYGILPEDFHGTRDDWTRRLHPEDAAAATERLASAQADPGSAYDMNFRILRPDGTVRHVEAHGYLQRNSLGQPLRLVGLNRDITTEKSLEEDLRVAEERWQLALEGNNDGVWDWNFQTGIQYHDERWARMLGYEPEEVSPDMNGWFRLVHPEDSARGDITLREHLAGRLPFYQAEYRMLAKSGEWKWIHSRGRLVSHSADGKPLRLVGTHTDITARKQLEQRLQRTDELADQVSRLAHIGGWEMDLNTMQVTWSTEICRILELDEGYQPSIEDVRKFFPSGTLETWRGLTLAGAASINSFDHELPLVTNRSRHIWVRVLGRVELSGGRPTRVHGAVQDITAQHRAEKDRRQLEIQLFHAQKMETLGTLSGGIAHDFNNLLTGIIGYHELAADSVPEDHPARACLAEARNASLRARELVEQILTFSHQSATEELVAVDLGLVIEEARRFLRATLPANIAIEMNLDPKCGQVLADATQIHQLILNLGSNAAHAMRAHGGTLTIALSPQEISAEQAATLDGIAPGLYVSLSVSDSGHGMNEVTLRRIFEPFFTTKKTREGTGLGLAVVHGIVRAHRGATAVESKVGVGTVFRIYLPVARGDQAATIIDSVPAPRGAGECIWVVDDEGIVGRFTRASLQKSGYQALVFSSAEECLAALRENPAGCQLLVTDQTMPGMQGTELAAAMQAQIPGLSVVLMSGYFSKISSDALDELGHVELLAKPFTSEQLAHAVHRALLPARAAAKNGSSAIL